MSVLPELFSKFFDDSVRQFTVNHKPSWLISDMESDVWLVDNKGDLRMVNGKFEGGTNIRWDKDFPGGWLSSPQYTLIREQFRSVLIWSHDGPIALLGNSLRDIKFFHRALYWFLEFLDLRYDSLFREKGLVVASIEDLIDFLDLYQSGGVTATSDMIARWEKFLVYAQVDPNNVDAAKAYLLENEAYGEDGKLNSKFIANALCIRTHRVRQLEPFSAYLNRYEFSQRTRSDRDPQRVTGAVARIMIVVSRALATMPELSIIDLARTDRVIEALKSFKRFGVGRTRTLPIAVGQKLLRGCCDWMVNVYPKVQIFLKELEASIEPEALSVEGGVIARIIRAEENIKIDPKLVQIAGHWRRRPSDPSRQQRLQNAMPVVLILLRLHIAVCYSLIGLLACCRRKEVTEILDLSLSEGPSRTVPVALRKTGIDSSRRVMHKPVPQIVIDCLSSLSALKGVCLNMHAKDDPQLRRMAFFQFGLQGISVLDPESINGLLTELSLHLDLRENNGRQWLLRSHELRRYFAMTFFNMAGEENSLPALSLFMGHANIERTWRYVKESLTGKELTVAEAAMARSAICSDDKSENVQYLRAVVLKYFGCNSIELLAADEVQDYLEVLAEDGVFTATPVQIQCAGHEMFTILISLTGTAIDA
ncbi:TPA: hypothetical protein ACG5DM_003839 [Pseudomonas putida]